MSGFHYQFAVQIEPFDSNPREQTIRLNLSFEKSFSFTHQVNILWSNQQRDQIIIILVDLCLEILHSTAVPICVDQCRYSRFQGLLNSHWQVVLLVFMMNVFWYYYGCLRHHFACLRQHSMCQSGVVLIRFLGTCNEILRTSADCCFSHRPPTNFQFVSKN